MKNYIVSFLLLPIHLLCSNGDGPIGPRSASLGHASSSIYDVWSTRNNQGSLGFVRQVEAGAFYENRFFVKELTQSGFATVVPIKTPPGSRLSVTFLKKALSFFSDSNI